MTDPPAQFKDRSDYSPGEWLTYLQSGQPAENPAYEEARRAALEAAGLEADITPAATPIEDMTPSQHLSRIRSHE